MSRDPTDRIEMFSFAYLTCVCSKKKNTGWGGVCVRKAPELQRWAAPGGGGVNRRSPLECSMQTMGI